ncbi:hypothetical protein DOTSEDRAFT_81403 [Dothistroma septosporum NZE10]|uniref:Threonylcarbamoyl-AMP synthase n=1 Tax=Dothistroma septosporum (strain NZE10 / CBS 128990) TaxID=675120 RepID=N1PMD3_DOTSN|nr:hypothetical protein DOTSEDRAFT_81403 [Dothistroma septosporum NZE10]
MLMSASIKRLAFTGTRAVFRVFFEASRIRSRSCIGQGSALDLMSCQECCVRLRFRVNQAERAKIGSLSAAKVPGDILDELKVELDMTSLDAQYLIAAAAKLRSSDVPVAFPTETVYGLGADATRSAAVKGIYKAKQRPSDNPLIVHFASLSQLRSLLTSGDKSSQHNDTLANGTTHDPIPEIYRPLISRFWPGPLTIILRNPENSPLAPEVTAGLVTFGARMPSHILAAALIQLAGVPVAAPSANASTKPSPTAAEHVAYDLNGRIETILDGGPCDVGVESTVVDGLSEPPLILRPGGISLDQIRECSGWEATEIGYKSVAESGSQPRAPGMKYRHYSPKATVILYEYGKDAPISGELLRQLGPNGKIGVIQTRSWVINSSTVDVIQSKADAKLASNGHRNRLHAMPGFAGMLKTLRNTRRTRSAIQTHLVSAAGNTTRLLSIDLGPDTADIARGIFSALRDLDREDVDAIFVEGINDGEGDTAAAVMNRLRKAAEVTNVCDWKYLGGSMGSVQDDSALSKDNGRELTILVTGFGPFQDKFPVNPSFEITHALPDYLPPTEAYRNGVRIIPYPDPIRVAFDEVRGLVPKLHEAYAGKVDVVLHLGMASGRRWYSLERYGHREGYTKNKDLDGQMPDPDEGKTTFGDCPSTMTTSLDYERILLEWQVNVLTIPKGQPGHQADIRPSEDAGHYLCDYIYFNSLACFGRKNTMEGGNDSSRPVLFFHVPAESDGFTLERGQAVTQALIRAIASSSSQQRSDVTAKGLKAQHILQRESGPANAF